MRGMEYQAVLTEGLDKRLTEFLLSDPQDEEICFAVWFPARGKTRYTAIIREPIWPQDGERERHGTVSALPNYVDRAKELARQHDGGLAMIHTHPAGRGWQNVSTADLYFERDVLSREVFGITGFPFVGITLAGDRTWSARFYLKQAQGKTILSWCNAVRVVGKYFRACFNPTLKPAPKSGQEQLRTCSVWGEQRQADIMRLRVGIIGAGSVGSGVAEVLSRIGVGELYVMDYDFVQSHNLDRLLHATQYHANRSVNKAELVCKYAEQAATTARFKCTPYANTSIVEEEGYRLALDCDVLFSCVDRPWPRQVMNHIAYTCLVPVIDGGVSFKLTNNHRLVHGMFRAQTVGPERVCMNCLGVFDPGLVQQDREGSLDDPEYIEQLRKVGREPQRQNIMPFSLGLASLETIQFAELVTGLARRGDLGQQPYDYYTGEILPTFKSCHHDCEYLRMMAYGDLQKPVLSTDATKERLLATKNTKQLATQRKTQYLANIISSLIGYPRPT